MIAYMIYCSTGCTCCASENHHVGPYKHKEIAEKDKQFFHDYKRLASQYAAYGRYFISEHEAEELPDGRVIIGDRVFSGFIDADPEAYRSHDEIYHFND